MIQHRRYVGLICGIIVPTAVVAALASWYAGRMPIPSEAESNRSAAQTISDRASPLDYATDEAERAVARRIDPTRGWRDCFRVIESPKFVTPEEAKGAMRDDEVVLGFVAGDDARAYPINLLNDHEMVRDDIGGQPILVTW
jgi:hypothetical protein